jgi:cephalosporin-C deacetylase-like acetyl esterase
MMHSDFKIFIQKFRYICKTSDSFSRELLHAYLLSAVAVCAAMKPVKLRRKILVAGQHGGGGLALVANLEKYIIKPRLF